MSTPSKDAKIGAAVDKCRDKDGIIQPALVVKAAQNKNSILHGEFEWDNAKLIKRALLEQAKEIIRRCKSIIDYGEFSIVIPHYIKDPTTPLEPGYVRTVNVAKDKGLKRLSLLAEMDRVLQAVSRGRSLAIFYEIADGWDDLAKRCEMLKSRI